MGNPKQKWTSEEEEALRAGVAKHGAGKWKNIQRDPEFNHLLYSRSNIDLKDKWRNLNVSANGQGPRDKSRTQKVKANPDVAASPLPITQAPVSSTLVPQDVLADTVIEDSSKCALDGKTASKYNQMIYDALSSLKEPNGSDTSTLVNFIEQRHEVPQNFRRLLSSRLRRLVQQDKLEKISFQETSNMDNRWKITVDRIYQKMVSVEESIAEKSQKLFKIRDEMSILSEDARKLQYELNQLDINQVELMEEFQLLCEHLDTRPKGYSVPNKVEGDVPPAPSAKNISKVKIRQKLI